MRDGQTIGGVTIVNPFASGELSPRAAALLGITS
jgi:hypothetical protein